MLQVVRDPKKDGVAVTGIWRLAKDLLRFAVTQLQEAAGIHASTQVQTHPDQPVFTDIVVPGNRVVGGREHSVYPTNEAPDSPAAGNPLNDFEQGWAIGKKVQKADRVVRLEARLCGYAR